MRWNLENPGGQAGWRAQANHRWKIILPPEFLLTHKSAFDSFFASVRVPLREESSPTIPPIGPR